MKANPSKHNMSRRQLHRTFPTPTPTLSPTHSQPPPLLLPFSPSPTSLLSTYFIPSPVCHYTRLQDSDFFFLFCFFTTIMSNKFWYVVEVCEWYHLKVNIFGELLFLHQWKQVRGKSKEIWFSLKNWGLSSSTGPVHSYQETKEWKKKKKKISLQKGCRQH